MPKETDDAAGLRHARRMKFINMYLVGYVLLLIGGLLALWKVGVLDSISPIWLVIGFIVAVGVGIMMSVSAGKPDITRQ